MSSKDDTKTAGRGRFARKTAVADAPRERSLRPLRMVWQAGSRYPGHVALALLALFITAAATLAIPAGFKMVIDRGFAEGATPDDMARWFRYLLMIVGVLALGTAMRFYYVSWLGERVVADIRLRVQENLLRLAPGFYEENSPKEISSRMTSDTALIEQVVGTTVSVALRNALMAIGGSAYLFWLVPGLTMGLLLIIPAIVIPITLFGRRLRKVSRTSQDRVADIGAMVTEVLSAMKIVQGFNQEDREHGRFREAVERTFAVARRRVIIRAAMTAVVILLVFGGITLLVWRGAQAVSEGTISGGTIAAFVLTAGLVAGAIGALTEVYGDLLRGAGAASRLSELLEEKPAITAPDRPAGPARTATRKPVVPQRHFPLSDAARSTRHHRFQPRDRARRNGRDRRPVGSGQVDHFPARRTVLRSAGGFDQA